MSRAFQLFRLQQVDTQLDQARARLKEIDALLKENKAVRHAEAQKTQAELAWNETRRSLNVTDGNTKAQRIKIEQTDLALYGGRVTHPKELQDLQNDAAALRRFLETLEERQLEAMVLHEDAETSLTSATRALEDAQARLIEANAALIGEQTRLTGEVERLSSERVMTEPGVPPDDLLRYAKLREKRRGIAVAQANGQSCSACGASLSATLFQAARSPTTLTVCDTCGRILYAA